MNTTCRVLGALLALAVVPACAGVKHVAMPGDPAKFALADMEEEGIRYYESSLYLLVHSDTKGNVTSKFLHMPDPSKPMAIRPRSVLASLESTFLFDKGVLTSASALGDEAVIPKAVVAAAQDVIGSLVETSKAYADESTQNVPAPSLFKIVVDASGVHFHGGQGDIGIDVVKPKPKPMPKKEKK